MKEIVIIYFSATGNTKVVADDMTNRFKYKGFKVKLIPVEDIEQIKELDLSDKILGIGFPVYGGTYPNILFDKAIKCIMKQNKIIPAFLFYTCAGGAFEIVSLIRKLEEKNIYTLIKNGFKCPSSGWGTFLPEKLYKISSMGKFDKNLFIKVKNFVEGVTKRIAKFEKKPFTKRWFAIPMPQVLVKLLGEKFESKFLFNNLTINKDKCTKCGLCVKACPVNNIIEEENEINILNKDYCLWCGRCISICPKNAIFWGSHKAHRQYTREFRDELLKTVKRID